jgi:hypothetical protein
MQYKSGVFCSIMLLLTSLSGTASAQPGCDRACLTGIMDSYLNGLLNNSAANIPLAANVKITDNNSVKSIGETFWDSAASINYRFDIANPVLGDAAVEAVIGNSDGSLTMLMVRLKVLDRAITELEVIHANQGDADGLWGPEQLRDTVSFELQMSPREQDSYYRLIAAAESYWRAFQTNGSDDYHPADLLPDSRRFENGLQTTGLVRNGAFVETAAGFHQGRFSERNLWDRRYPVVDQEKGVVLSIVRFGLKEGRQSLITATSSSRLVGEFFAVQKGYISEVHAVLFNLPEDVPSAWPADYGPPRGGWPQE